ncbi:uncharacterized protein K02A2.6-like [Lingula anatina]|uniref:Uncharacterized protein K02A2.6-like n=1 Tax=Lingula anatina TaxID=7574 RepID=A0A1S3IDC3_LINAN|nr:uncharacterized protein K02A2.6-like [Lingula anatina]|eukprot:XP_013396158.1 uncharacterized protein K02A2.6-like [Lingula anatina]
MAYAFEQPSFDWESKYLYLEFTRFRQHAELVFKGPLSQTDDKIRAGWLGMWIGKQGREIYKTFTWEEDEEDKPEAIFGKLENYYQDAEDILIDCIIRGVYYPRVQEKLLEKGERLTLAQALEIGRQYESSQQQMKILRPEVEVSAINHKSHKSKESHASRNPSQASKRQEHVPWKQNNKKCVKADYEKLSLHKNLNQTTKVLRFYSNHKIRPIRKAQLSVAYNTTQLPVDFEVVDIDQENVINGEVSEKVGLLHRVRVNKVNSVDDFTELARNTGTLPGKHTIKIDPTAKGVIHPARRQPASLKPRIVEKLQEMESDGFITRVHEPNEWVSSMVVSLRNDKVRICIDPCDLNNAIKGEHHPLTTIEEVVASIPKATVFSVLDATQGFLQIQLDEQSSFLTTFNTPIGRYRWLRLPFGIKSAPEIFQRIMDEMLEGIEGATAIMDDILIAGTDREHHDSIFKKVIQRATEYNLKLNFDKCQVRQPRVQYVGHILTAEGLSPDPEKVRTITDMTPPTDKDGVRRILGLIQYLAKFIPNLSQVDAPLRALLKNDVSFKWEHEQQASFEELKHLCSTPPVLAYYDVNKPVEIQCDASRSGLGAVLIQDGRPIAYTSRSLTDVEMRYAQIEKEMLAIVHGAIKFHCYIFGKETTMYTDHKPLESILKKPLLSAPMRLQKMLLRLQWYNLNVVYRKGKDMVVADTLSRAYLPDTSSDVTGLDDLCLVDMISVSSERYSDIRTRTQRELQPLYNTIVQGWPDTRRETPYEIRNFWDSRDQLSVFDGVIYKGLRIVIPPSLQKYMLSLIHESHLGVVKCKQRAREVMFWPGMNMEIENMVRDCINCSEYQNRLPAEPLKPTVPPDLPYTEVGCDIFYFGAKKYLLLIDYYSKYIDVVELNAATTTATINAIKYVFSCHGIPLKIRSDNGPQFSSCEFKQFCKVYDIEHMTSSPQYPGLNGEAERAIQIVKKMWKKCDDKYLALLNYRTTPLEGINLSPSQLLMGRRPRNTLPAARNLLKPQAYNQREVKRHFSQEKLKQKYYHDQRKGAKELKAFNPGEHVRMQPHPGSKTWVPAIVVKRHTHPRSYIVEGNDRVYRRNRQHLRSSTEKAHHYNPNFVDLEPCNEPLHSPIKDQHIVPEETVTPTRDQCKTPTKTVTPAINTPRIVTRSGRVVKPPDRLNV